MGKELGRESEGERNGKWEVFITTGREGDADTDVLVKLILD